MLSRKYTEFLYASFPTSSTYTVSPLNILQSVWYIYYKWWAQIILKIQLEAISITRLESETPKAVLKGDMVQHKGRK